MARTNIILDDELVEEGMKLSGASTKRDLVDRALRAYIKQMKRKKIRALRGAVEYHEGYDHRELRQDRFRR